MVSAAWQSGDAAPLFETPSEKITVNGPGRLSIETEDGCQIELHFTLWRDNWVFRQLTYGRDVRTRSNGGVVEQTGKWGDFAETLPIDFHFVFSRHEDGVDIEVTFTRTEEIELTSGVWIRAEMLGKFERGRQQIAVHPGPSGRLGRTFADFGSRIDIDTDAGRRLHIAFDRPGLVRSKMDGTAPVIAAKLFDDLPLGEPVEAAVRLRFGERDGDYQDHIVSKRTPLRLQDVDLYVNGNPAAPDADGTIRVTQYDTLEYRMEVGGKWKNPYDPDQISLTANVTSASRTYGYPGFYMLDFQRQFHGDVETWAPQPTAKPWRIRLTADEPGPLRCQLRVVNGRKRKTVALPRIEVVAGNKRGFLRTSQTDPHYFQYDNGEGCFLIGHNLPIYNNIGKAPDTILQRMADNGENCCRIWMSSDSLGIEWEDRPGRYRQESAARLDHFMVTTERLGINVMLCLDTHQDFAGQGWLDNPYNKVNGGFCKKPQDWFTRKAAHKQYRKRLRYLVARWGYATNLLCWEFGNEFEGWPEADESTVIAWHQTMAPVLKALDPYKHLVTTSWWTHMGPEACWRIPEIDIVQTHVYTNNDSSVADPVTNYTQAQWLYYEKPHMFSEFGVDSEGPPRTTDPRGWCVHNSMWAAVAGGGASAAMPWWHSTYIDPLNLYFHFGALRRFVNDLPFGTATWQQFQGFRVQFEDETVRFADVVILPSTKWARPALSEFMVNDSGMVTNDTEILEYLHGTDNETLRNPPVFKVDCARPFRFVVSVGRVSRSGKLHIWIDDELKVERDLPAGKGHGKAWSFQGKWNIWQSLYDEDFVVEIPAGRHKIRVANGGLDWIRVKRYVFEGYRKMQPDLMVSGMRTDEVAFVWLHNRRNTWRQNWVGGVEPIAPTQVSVAYPAGTYTLEWWNTWDGEILSTDTITTTDKLVLSPGELATDIAVKIIPQEPQ
ncbi:MAG TPA: hypothetical protein DIT01_18820 [Lentisphaeria bacterium]|nr:hypothetical protein [Lentisphaeria bacterium]